MTDTQNKTTTDAWGLMEQVWFDGAVELLLDPSIPDDAIAHWVEQQSSGGYDEPNLDGVTIGGHSLTGVDRDAWRELASLNSRPDLSAVFTTARLSNEDAIRRLVDLSHEQGWARVDAWFPALVRSAYGVSVEHIWHAVSLGAVAAVKPKLLAALLCDANLDETFARTIEALSRGYQRNLRSFGYLFFFGKQEAHQMSVQQMQRVGKELRNKILDELSLTYDPSGGLLGLPPGLLMDVVGSSGTVDMSLTGLRRLKEL